MAYNVLVKKFEQTREYMRNFYVYGFKSRSEYDEKSARSYDNERRRVGSWLGNNMRFHSPSEGNERSYFITVDTRVRQYNPLYKAWKVKSFTKWDMMLHFALFDILGVAGEPRPRTEIIKEIEKRFELFDVNLCVPETVWNKLEEYEKKGLICSEMRGNECYHWRAPMSPVFSTNVLDYFSEVMPCGVIGSCLLDSELDHAKRFGFKHHYITGTLDSEVMYLLFEAMHHEREVVLKYMHEGIPEEKKVVPLRILISVQNGKQYLMAYVPKEKRISSFRLDDIVTVVAKKTYKGFVELRKRLAEMLPHMWEVNTSCLLDAEKLEHVDFLVKTDKEYIHSRLRREKRCGKVEKIDSHTSKFSADVYDSGELIPWMRTFVGSIAEINFSNEALRQEFMADVNEMYRLYGLEGGEIG